MKFNIFKLKIAVLVIFAGLAITFFTFSSNLQITTEARSGGTGGGATAAPGESDCTDCHDQNTLTGQFTITPPANYTPGQTYPVQVEHTTTDMSRLRWGFEITALTAANAAAGTFADTTPNTNSFSNGGRNYVDQTSTGSFDNTTGGATWNFNWTAPATDVGPITFYAAGLQANSSGTGNDQTYTVNQQVPVAPAIVPNHDFADFDGDGKADPSIFRPSEGNWYVDQSSGGVSVVNWGIASDNVTPADFDGDDKTDHAVWREGPAGVAAFYILESSSNTLRIEQFGQTGDSSAVVGDWDGDGNADPAVYRDGAQSFFYFIGSLNNPGGNVTYLPWGTTGDKPMRGDFDGDGKMDLAVFRPSNNVWYINQSSNGQLLAENFGLSSDKFVTGDFDGDAKTDVTVFRDGVWYVKQSSDGSVSFLNWGSAGDVLVPADYDGDGKTDTAVYRDGVWWINQSSNGSVQTQNFGLTPDNAVPSYNVR